MLRHLILPFFPLAKSSKSNLRAIKINRDGREYEALGIFDHVFQEHRQHQFGAVVATECVGVFRIFEFECSFPPTPCHSQIQLSGDISRAHRIRIRPTFNIRTFISSKVTSLAWFRIMPIMIMKVGCIGSTFVSTPSLIGIARLQLGPSVPRWISF